MLRVPGRLAAGPAAVRRMLRRKPAGAARRPDPARSVARLLLWQGTAWVVLAAAGLGLWVAALPARLAPGGSWPGALWTCAQLAAIAVGAGVGAAEISAACRLPGRPRADRPRVVRIAVVSLQGAALAACLAAAAVSVMILGCVLAVLTLNGALLARTGPSISYLEGPAAIVPRAARSARYRHAGDELSVTAERLSGQHAAAPAVRGRVSAR